MSRQSSFAIETDGPGLYEITQRVARWTAGCGDGLLTLFVRHSSASLLVQENADPDVQADLRDALDQLVPPGDDPRMAWLRHTVEGPDDMPAHIKAAILPVSLSIPVRDGAPVLGTWQGIFLFEHRTRPRRREIAAMLIAGSS